MSQFENGEIFAADGDLLKITSMSKAPYNILDGKCQLIKISDNKYSWVLTKEGVKERKFTFIVSKDSDIKCTVREGNFTITYRNKKIAGNNTTQLIGELKDKSLGTLLQQNFDEIKKYDNRSSNNNTWLNTSSLVSPKPSPLNASSIIQPRSSPFNVSNIIRPKISTSFQDENSLFTSYKENNVKQTSKNVSNYIPLSSNTSKRTPLGEKAGYTSKSSIFPTQESFYKSPNQLNQTPVKSKSSDPDVQITSYGASKGNFYNNNKISVKKRFNFVNTKPKLTGDSGIFQQRNDALKVLPKRDSMNTVVGFSNLGNTCYMNSILQCLLNIPNFFQDLNNESNVNLVKHDSLYNSLCNLGVLKYSYETVENQRFALKRVKNAISSAASRFSGYAQHDAHEFLCQCLDQLKDDLSVPLKAFYDENNIVKAATDSEEQNENNISVLISNSEEPNANKCPIRENYESVINHSIICEQCGENVDKSEACHDFSLVIPEQDENSNPCELSIVDLFDFYFMEEVIDYTCDKCKSTGSLLSHQFKKLPRVLIVHVKRYDVYDTKRNDRINLPQKIDMSKHTSKNVKLPDEYLYDSKKLKVKSVSDFVSKRKSLDSIHEPVKKLFKSDISKEQYINMEGEHLAQAARDSKRDEELHKRALENNFTKIKQNTKPPLHCSSPSVMTKNKDDEILGDIFNEEFDITEDLKTNGISKLTTVSDDEEDEFQKALELSLRDFQETKRQNSFTEKALQESLLDFEETKRQASVTEKAMQESLLDFEKSKARNSLTDNNLIKETTNVKVNASQTTNNFEKNTDDDIVTISDPNSSYHLVGIVNHHGQDTNTGHYTSDSFDFKSKRWRNFNDSTVKEINEHEVRYGRGESAYIVFYMHEKCYNEILKACCQI